LTILTGIAVTGLLVLVALVYLRQEALIFQPEPLPADYAFGLPDVKEVRIQVDGATLSALHLQLLHPKGVVFFLHGNAGNLASWFVNSEFYRQANFDLFMLDYRGYGKSTGRIRSEAQLRSDVAAAWRAVAARYQGLRKVVYGRSLGTALAAGLAAQIQPDMTILVSPFWSMAELGRAHYPLLPSALLRYPLQTFKDIARVQGPVLLIHGDRDRLIPFDHSVRLRALTQNAQLVLVHGAAHNDIQDFDQYRLTILDRLAQL